MNASFHATSPDQTLADAAKEMLSRRISTLPVVDAQKRLVGALYIEDLLPKVEPVPFTEDVEAFKLFDRWLDERNLESFYENYRQVLVQKLMHQRIHTVSPDDTLTVVLRAIRRSNFRSLFVINEQSHLLGLISRSDLLRLLLGVDV